MSRLLLLVQICGICCCLLLLNYVSIVQCDGMIEVYRWKQIDYYNRGDGSPVSGDAYPGPNRKPMRHQTPNANVRDSPIVFPDDDDDEKYAKRYKRQAERMTSRDHPVRTESRFNLASSTTSGNNDSYIAYNNVPMGVSHYKGRVFVTMPRRRTGIPSTLNYIDVKRDGASGSPKLRAYPDFETNQFVHNGDNSNKLVSVYRTTIDECGRFWFIDTGMLEYPNNRTQIKRPQIWIMDLKTDRVIHKFDVPTEIVQTGRGMASITVDTIKYKCQQAYAYIPDLVNSRLYVYSLEQNRMWSFQHNYFNFDPVAGDLNVGGQVFRWDDGIFSTTLGPRRNNDERDVFFHPMASNNEFVVSNKVLQNETNAARDYHGYDFRLLGSRGEKSQSTMHEYDPLTGSIFYNQIQKNGVACWNTKKTFSAENHDLIFRDDKRMIYPSDLTIDSDGYIWVMSNSMPIFIYSTLDTSVDNFRIWKQHVFDAVENTNCALEY